MARQSRKRARIQNSRIALAIGGALTFFASPYTIEVDHSPIDVPTGQLRYSEGRPLKSDDFASCSALILDSGDSAVLGHAFFNDFEGNPYAHRGFNVHIDVGNVVTESVQELQKNGIDYRTAEAIVIAGEEKGLKRILGELESFGIPVRDAYIGDGYHRHVTYDPRTNEVIVAHE